MSDFSASNAAVTALPEVSLTDPLSSLGVGDLTWDGEVGTAVAQLSARFADHRGRIDLPALAVLFDHLGGLPYFRTHGSGTLQARLAISMLGRVDNTERLSGRAWLKYNADGFGATTVEIAGADGRAVSVGTARNASVGRAIENDPAEHEGHRAPAGPEAPGVELPPVIEPELGGAEIIAQIAAGVRRAGPLAEMLNGRIELAESPTPGALRFICVTAPWMGNHFQTMHGGVIGTIVAQGCSFAAQAVAAAGRDYQLGDLAVSFLRSPAVDGGEVVVDVAPVKTGRRISSFDATMHSADGVLLSRATADALYFDR